MSVVTLQIKSFAIPGLTAVHYYGVLRCPGHKPHRLERVINADEAAALNAYDNTPGLYRHGSKTERFSSAEQVRIRAREVWPEIYPDAMELNEGEEIP